MTEAVQTARPPKGIAKGGTVPTAQSAATRNLRKRQRLLARDLFIEGATAEDIATRLTIPLSTVNNWAQTDKWNAQRAQIRDKSMLITNADEVLARTEA